MVASKKNSEEDEKNEAEEKRNPKDLGVEEVRVDNPGKEGCSMANGHTMGDVLVLFKRVTGCLFYGNHEDHSKEGVKPSTDKVDDIIAAQAANDEVAHRAAEENTTATLCKLAEQRYLAWKVWLTEQPWAKERLITG